MRERDREREREERLFTFNSVTPRPISNVEFKSSIKRKERKICNAILYTLTSDIEIAKIVHMTT